MENIRKMAEKCDKLYDFQIYHSVSGGTGSGITSMVLEELR